jgi:hypothetical protein
MPCFGPKQIPLFRSCHSSHASDAVKSGQTPPLDFTDWCVGDQIAGFMPSLQEIRGQKPLRFSGLQPLAPYSAGRHPVLGYRAPMQGVWKHLAAETAAPDGCSWGVRIVEIVDNGLENAPLGWNFVWRRYPYVAGG